MHIYQLPVSLYSFKLRLAIKLKGLHIELRPPPGGTYRSAEYRRINPAGTIPALIDGALTLSETDAIIEYLEEQGLGQPLFPADPRQRARMRMLSRWNDLRLEPAIRQLFPQLSPAARDGAFVASADAHIGEALALIESQLDAGGAFATGTMPGMADCGLMASLVWLESLTAPMMIGTRLGERFSALMRSMAGHGAITSEVSGYRQLLQAWISERSQP